jgi:hypothetical protein
MGSTHFHTVGRLFFGPREQVFVARSEEHRRFLYSVYSLPESLQNEMLVELLKTLIDFHEEVLLIARHQASQVSLTPDSPELRSLLVCWPPIRNITEFQSFDGQF